MQSNRACMPGTGLWKKVQERITQRKAMSLPERRQEAIGVVEAILAKSKAKITLSQVKRATRQPEPYNKPCLNTTEEVCCPCVYILPTNLLVVLLAHTANQQVQHSVHSCHLCSASVLL